MNFSEKDILHIEEKGLSTNEVEEQIEIFKRGNIKVNITEAATVGNGISKIDSAEKKDLSNDFIPPKLSTGALAHTKFYCPQTRTVSG